MRTSLNADELAGFEGVLRERASQLREEIRDTREREKDEPFGRVAAEAHDAGDASLADLVVHTNSAAVGRDAGEMRDIDKALGRIAVGSYGVCLRCGEPIDSARLKALPTAKYDLRCQEIVDRARGAPQTPTL